MRAAGLGSGMRTRPRRPWTWSGDRVGVGLGSPVALLCRLHLAPNRPEAASNLCRRGHAPRRPRSGGRQRPERAADPGALSSPAAGAAPLVDPAGDFRVGVQDPRKLSDSIDDRVHRGYVPTFDQHHDVRGPKERVGTDHAVEFPDLSHQPLRTWVLRADEHVGPDPSHALQPTQGRRSSGSRITPHA
jgi:hypothetical protein